MTVSIEGLHFSWGRHRLFDNLTARTGVHGVYGLFGRNGSGKSTLLKILAGLQTPDSGQIRVNGQEPRQRAAAFLSGVYILPEEFHLPDLTTRVLGRTQGRFYPHFDATQFESNLQALDVPADQRFSRMSLGQKKKAAIAFALATMTPVLLMDEPTNGLDIISRSTFKALLSDPVHRERLVVISTHQAHDLESLMQHIWFIDAGRIVLSASMDELACAIAMGVAASASELPQAHLIYQEAVGQHLAWVAGRSDRSSACATGVQLEMLYKALSHNKDAVLACMAPTQGGQP
jgi:ABC-2 type transport system ATP-binding protein